MDEKEKMAEVEKENAALRECISDVLSRATGYDGYNTVEGLKRLIDIVVKTLTSGYPERLVDYKGREVCPLCFHKKEK